MRIAYYVHDLRFPLREGIRKQAWWMAVAMKRLGHDVVIISTSKEKKKIRKQGINIVYGSPFSIATIKADVLHVLSHPSPLIIPLLIHSRAKKIVMTMYDGYLNSFWKRPWAFIMSWLVNRKVDAITVQTKYQRKLLAGTKILRWAEIVDPIFPDFKKTKRKTKNPSLLFMSHLHLNKGIEDVLSVFHELIEEYPDLALTIANSGVTFQEKRIRAHSNIRYKRVVNPQDELSSHWIYLYPIKSPQETFSIPLSLIEAIQTKTSFISTSVGSILDYFDKDFLVRPGDRKQLKQKIIEMIENRPKHKPIKFDNNKTIKRFIELYERI